MAKIQLEIKGCQDCPFFERVGYEPLGKELIRINSVCKKMIKSLPIKLMDFNDPERETNWEDFSNHPIPLSCPIKINDTSESTE